MAIKTTELIRTSQSWDGAILPNFPQGRPELRVIRLDFPVGAKTGWHHHTVVNYGIVQQGELTIVCQDGSEKTFCEGEPLFNVSYPSLGGVEMKHNPSCLCPEGLKRMAREFKNFPEQYEINLRSLKGMNNDILSGVNYLIEEYNKIQLSAR